MLKEKETLLWLLQLVYIFYDSKLGYNELFFKLCLISLMSRAAFEKGQKRM